MTESNGSSHSYLVCYPTGGLADTLQIIAAGIALAVQTQRVLVISKKGAQIHGAHIDALFDFRSHESILLEDEIRAETAARLSGPGAHNQFVLESGGGKNRLSRSINQLKLMSDERTVHLWRGVGVVKAVEVFNHLRIHNDILKDIRVILNHLGGEFAAVHIRNTDYRTDYESVLKKLARMERCRPILLATDSPLVREWAKAQFGSRLIGLERFGFMDEAPIHKIKAVGDMADPIQLAREAFLDLLILGSAPRLYIAPTAGLVNSTAFKFSGFSLLAENLNTSEKFWGFIQDGTGEISRPHIRKSRRIVTGGMIGRMVWKQRLAVARFFGRP